MIWNLGRFHSRGDRPLIDHIAVKTFIPTVRRHDISWKWTANDTTIGPMQGKLNWPNLVSKNRARKVTWKTRRANLETLGFRRYLGFSPKTWPTNSSVWRNLTAAAAWALHSHTVLRYCTASFVRKGWSSRREWRAGAAAAVKFLHTLLLVGHVLGENPRYLLNPRVSRFALQVFQVTFWARFFDTKFGQFNFPCIRPIIFRW
jgi:hypothetical protein